MAKAKKPAAKKSSGAAGRTSTRKPAASKSSASVAAEKATEEVTKTSTAVSPSEIKKELEASAKPTPPVAKEAPSTFDVKESDADTADTIEGATADAPVAVAPPPAERGSVFWPLVFGGVIAAVLGFLASELDLLGNRSQTDDLRATLAAQDTRLSALESVEPVEMPEVTFPALDDLTAQATAMAAQLQELDERLTTVEKQPITGGTSQAAVAAYERELAALQASVETQRAEIEGLLNNALSVEEATAEAARGAKVQAALTEISSAIGDGQPFAGALAALTEHGVTDVPAALSGAAETGVQTLNALQTRFPDAARASLGAARASGANETETGFGGFLRRQLGARSVTPREGDDPDAVLSRAEAAVREGRLADALGELETLPVPAQEAMQDWLTDAQARQAAQAAAQDLSQSLTAN